MKVLYIPARLIAHLLGGIVGKKANARIWAMISDKPKPPTNADGQTLLQVASGAALEAAILAATAGVADQLAARFFHRVMGAWPAHAESESDTDAKSKRKSKAEPKTDSTSETEPKTKSKRKAKRKTSAEHESQPSS